MKQTLFISYCWQDGTFYADELERQLKNKFVIKRDKSSLNCNDCIDDFMRKIADCDNVVIVLTEKYLYSKNCMKEATYLSKQPDWSTKCVVLVIYDGLYSFDTQEQVLSFWNNKMKSLSKAKNTTCSKIICNEEYTSVNSICNMLEGFLIEIRRRNNPSQISVVNDIITLSKRNRDFETKCIRESINKVQEIIASKGTTTLSEIEKETGYSKEVINRYVGTLRDEKKAVCYNDNSCASLDRERYLANSFISSCGKNSIDELTDDEYGDLEQIIANYRQHI